ncbi:MAG: hypothetical protein KF773_26805 [Deltaproteobacteria bacterium]|nr:hypothetical protein [Deltaproteobacteria bacterium]
MPDDTTIFTDSPPTRSRGVAISPGRESASSPQPAAGGWRDMFGVMSGRLSHAEYLRRRRRRGRVARAVARRPQRARATRRRGAASPAPAGGDDGDGEPPGDVVLALHPDGSCTAYVPVGGDVVVLSSTRPPRTTADLAAAVDIARRAVAGDSTVGWAS